MYDFDGETAMSRWIKNGYGKQMASLIARATTQRPDKQSDYEFPSQIKIKAFSRSLIVPKVFDNFTKDGESLADLLLKYPSRVALVGTGSALCDMQRWRYLCNTLVIRAIKEENEFVLDTISKIVQVNPAAWPSQQQQRRRLRRRQQQHRDSENASSSIQ
jgi:hypothetical protein